jgi:Spy/CpxP family protein refolding chaperone
MREKMEKQMKAYEEELQKIMTPEQYKSYKSDMEKRRKERPRGSRGQNGPKE